MSPPFSSKCFEVTVPRYSPDIVTLHSKIVSCTCERPVDLGLSLVFLPGFSIYILSAQLHLMKASQAQTQPRATDNHGGNYSPSFGPQGLSAGIAAGVKLISGDSWEETPRNGPITRNGKNNAIYWTKNVSCGSRPKKNHDKSFKIRTWESHLS